MDAPVLITGENGTGKELLAEAIHRNSRRFGRPFVSVNLGRITPAQFEHEMFGHGRSMPPDARAERKGRMESADRGTIFLDEIGDLDPASQVRLLRVLEDGAFEVPGSGERREVDVRVISATHRNLAQMAASGEFREDLLYRINLIALHLPPLRERPGDIPDPGDALPARARRTPRARAARPGTGRAAVAADAALAGQHPPAASVDRARGTGQHE